MQLLSASNSMYFCFDLDSTLSIPWDESFRNKFANISTVICNRMDKAKVLLEDGERRETPALRRNILMDSAQPHLVERGEHCRINTAFAFLKKKYSSPSTVSRAVSAICLDQYKVTKVCEQMVKRISKTGVQPVLRLLNWKHWKHWQHPSQVVFFFILSLCFCYFQHFSLRFVSSVLLQHLLIRVFYLLSLFFCLFFTLSARAPSPFFTSGAVDDFSSSATVQNG